MIRCRKLAPSLLRFGGWIAAVVVALLAFARLRRRAPSTDSQAATEARLREALRDELAQDADEKRAEADAHRERAEFFVEDAAELEHAVQAMTDDDVARELGRLQSDAAKRRARGSHLMPTFVLIALLQSAVAQAQALPEVVHPETGEVGFWIAKWYTRELLVLALTDEPRAEALAACQRADDGHRAEADRLRSSLDQAIAAGLAQSRRATEAEEAAREVEARAAAWWRSPWLWTSAGVVVGAVATERIVSLVRTP